MKNATDYKTAAQIIKDGGYATSSTYVQKLCDIIEKYNLTRFNATTSAVTSASGTTTQGTNTLPAVPFCVHVLINDLNIRDGASMSANTKGHTGKGTFTIVEVRDGWGKLKSGAGWIWLKNPTYCTVLNTVYNAVEFKPYAVRVDCNDLNIRKGPGTNYGKTGKHTGKGTFTIVEEKAGAGSNKGWGKLKSGAGWISLDYAVKA